MKVLRRKTSSSHLAALQSKSFLTRILALEGEFGFLEELQMLRAGIQTLKFQ